MASILYDKGREGFLDGSIDWDTDDVRAILVDAGAYTVSAAHDFLDDIAARSPHRVDGTAVFMTSAPMGTPPVLLHHFKHNKVLHEQIVLLSVVSEDQPFVARAERVQVEKLRHGFWRVTAHYGFMQTPRVTDILKSCHQRGLHTNRDDTSFFLGRETLVLTKKGGMALWRKMLFAVLSRNSRPATDFFQLPPNRVVEMGMQIEL